MQQFSKKDLLGALAQTQAAQEATAMKYARLKAEADTLVAILVKRLGGRVRLTKEEFADIRSQKLGKRMLPETEEEAPGGVELCVLSPEEVEAMMAAAKAKRAEREGEDAVEETEPKSSTIIIP